MKSPFPHHIRRYGLAAGYCVALSACAPMIATVPSTIEVTQPNVAARRIQILIATTVHLDTGYSRTLPERSVWSRIGRVP
ncbi:conserved exported hypothetical protein [Cupriavidus taiwanensis]|nr:conserved exported hypothetical protein [Cupriavidus taiwanensis]SPA08197.1 conserved exported hypothetical protein [Cupriavidus taiwanensis]